jgi:hypothetical protein
MKKLFFEKMKIGFDEIGIEKNGEKLVVHFYKNNNKVYTCDPIRISDGNSLRIKNIKGKLTFDMESLP